jgi:hypothetical protein
MSGFSERLRRYRQKEKPTMKSFNHRFRGRRGDVPRCGHGIGRTSCERRQHNVDASNQPATVLISAFGDLGEYNFAGTKY